jgi:hypothetical protein
MVKIKRLIYKKAKYRVTNEYVTSSCESGRKFPVPESYRAILKKERLSLVTPFFDKTTGRMYCCKSDVRF